MFEFFTKRLTEASGYMIDWSRATDIVLFKSSSLQTIAQRSAIAVFVAACGFLATSLKRPNNSSAGSSAALMITGVVVGLVVAHIPVVYPRYSKRAHMREQCKQYSDQIRQTFSSADNVELVAALEKVISAIMAYSVTHKSAAEASETWGHRLSLLKKMKQHLHNITPEECLRFYTAGDVASILLALNEMPAPVLVKKEPQHENAPLSLGIGRKT